ncbi:hypothetical protein GQ600_25441 [Phytophthora cactorum]|nr:hypothetical protein GQ600_25441 [Phytophthora cactorum]
MTTKDISPVLKPEVDDLLKLGMAAGRVRNMLLFKYLRDPTMIALVSETKKVENRKAYLKRLAGEGWEISKFITLRNWTADKLCQRRDDYARIDETNVADRHEQTYPQNWSCLAKYPNARAARTTSNTPGGLVRDSDPYDVDRLIQLFTKNPGRPLKWPVVQEFDIEDEGKTYKEHQVGQVAGCRLSVTEGVYVWSVVFIHGDSLEYQVEELAHAARRAHALGTQ